MKIGELILNKRFFLLCACAFLAACNNIFYPLSDDSSLTPQGRLDRGEQYMNQGDFDKALTDVEGALSRDSTLSEGYYLKAQIAIWRHKIDIDRVDTALGVGMDSLQSDSTPLFFSHLSQARKDSILQGNRIAVQNFEKLKKGTAGTGSTPIDSVIRFKDVWLDYTVSNTVLGIIQLYDADTNSTIDSLDSAALNHLIYCFGRSGFDVRDTCASDTITRTAMKKAAAQSLRSLQKAKPVADSLVIAYGRNTTAPGYGFRNTIKTTIQKYIADLPALAAKQVR